MMEAVRTSETSVDHHFTRQYNPEDSSEHSYKLFKNGQYFNFLWGVVTRQLKGKRLLGTNVIYVFIYIFLFPCCLMCGLSQMCVAAVGFEGWCTHI
jgi:hypothetical protein